jgi:hypothetical protein
MRFLLLINLVALALVACMAPAGPMITLRGHATAGPVCPVETLPPDPACEPRPVVVAEIVVRDESGEAVARVRTADDGRFAVSLPPGTYELVPQAVDGLMGTAPSVVVVLVEGTDPDPVEIGYDTGIR